MKKFLKPLSLILIFTFILAGTFNVQAITNDSNQTSLSGALNKQAQSIKEAFSKENVSKAISKYDYNKKGIQKFKLNNDYYLEVNFSLKSIGNSNKNQEFATTATTEQLQQATAQVDGKTVAGITVYSAKLQASFYYTDTTVRHSAVEAWSGNLGIGWSCIEKRTAAPVQISSITLQEKGFFAFQLYVGYAPIGMVVKTDGFGIEIDCHAGGVAEMKTI